MRQQDMKQDTPAWQENVNFSLPSGTMPAGKDFSCLVMAFIDNIISLKTNGDKADEVTICITEGQACLSHHWATAGGISCR